MQSAHQPSVPDVQGVLHVGKFLRFVLSQMGFGRLGMESAVRNTNFDFRQVVHGST